jgi:hypothetical protein
MGSSECTVEAVWSRQIFEMDWQKKKVFCQEMITRCRESHRPCDPFHDRWNVSVYQLGAGKSLQNTASIVDVIHVLTGCELDSDR